MTYFGFLAQFLGIPILLLLLLTWLDHRQGRRLPLPLCGWPAWSVLLGHIVVALVYTTPWDNYLVATGVWWYNPELVTGLTIGWVPIEEYTFFIVQTIFTGLWLLYLARRLPMEAQPKAPPSGLRGGLLFSLGLLWLGMAGILIWGWQPGTYLALILVWALPPVLLQIGFGLDILWRYRRLIGLTLSSVTLYLSLADALAIGSGTWTIDPTQSFQIYLAGVLPLEELVFFLMTNVLLVFGVVLVLSQESQSRVSPDTRERIERFLGFIWLFNDFNHPSKRIL